MRNLMSRPTFGSLFSGIGGFDAGLEAAGWACAFQVEVDPFCTKVLERHWPHVPRHRDIRGVTPTDLAAVDLLCGGFPCQDLSVAGRRAGLAGARSGLFFEFVRVATELRPRWLLLENVPGLHFEACYYQGIEYCLTHGLTTFEPGAQGEHKLARGFLPTKTRSFHYLADPRFRAAVREALGRESLALEEYRAELMAHSPYAQRASAVSDQDRADSTPSTPNPPLEEVFRASTGRLKGPG